MRNVARIAFKLAVLIETYWNVNLQMYQSAAELARGINRNILECKSNSGRTAFGLSKVLIETYWNVNSIY